MRRGYVAALLFLAGVAVPSGEQDGEWKPIVLKVTIWQGFSAGLWIGTSPSTTPISTKSFPTEAQVFQPEHRQGHPATREAAGG